MSPRSDRPDLKPRHVKITRGFMPQAEGSCLVEFGNTKVICTASVEDRVPPFLDPSRSGWITAEYFMLPRSTESRTPRRRARGPKGRTHEIERLIGRSLRQAVSLKDIKGHTIYLDCDVIGADGGTRTASITGAWVALKDAIHWLKRENKIKKMPDITQIAALSVGIVDGEVRVDLDYIEDSNADVDLNVVMNDRGEFIEVQGTGERTGFTREQLDKMLDSAGEAMQILFARQKEAATA